MAQTGSPCKPAEWSSHVVHSLHHHRVLVTKYQKKWLTPEMLDRRHELAGEITVRWDGCACTGSTGWSSVGADGEAFPESSESGNSMLENGARVPAGTSRRIACDASRVVEVSASTGSTGSACTASYSPVIGSWTTPGERFTLHLRMTALSDPTRVRKLLLEHYDSHRRELPWRENQDPYCVWVSEIMLQQTRVETAIPYYDRWMERFPTVEALAGVDEETVLKAWEGLGYYSRARNLLRSALIVRERLGGVVPQDSQGLKTLPGIGEYSASAIASIAYGEVVPAVDGNVRRVLSRLFDLEDPTAATLRERAGELVDPDRPGDWNQALMELGATVCTPDRPGARYVL